MVFTIFFVFACSSSSGSLIREEENTEKTDATVDIPLPVHYQDSETAVYLKGLFIEESVKDEGVAIITEPPDAYIYINEDYFGKTPMHITSLEPGTYRLRLELAGYYIKEQWINYLGENRLDLVIPLERITGYVNVSGVPKDAIIECAGERLAPGLNEVPSGKRILVVRAFGYEEYAEPIEVIQKQTIDVNITLKTADFTVTGLKGGRSRFNPRSPGELGILSLLFKVSGPGKGRTTVSSPAGEPVYNAPLGPFTTWSQEIRWNGRDKDGNVLQDGIYTVKIDTESETGQLSRSIETMVTIDTSQNVAYRSLWDGSSGLLFCSTPDILMKDSYQFSTAFSAFLDANPDTFVFRAPFTLGMRAGLLSFAELDFSVSAVLKSVDFIPFFISGSAKIPFLTSRETAGINASLCGKLTYHYGIGSDTLTNFTGLSVGIPFQVFFGPVSLLFEPEAKISPWEVTMTSSYGEEVSFNMWFYARSALLVDFGNIITGVSAAFRTRNIVKQDFGFAFPFQAGWELHYLMPESNLVLSLLATAEINPMESVYMTGGLGLGFLF
ncbi:MAG: PEGA domain-containing protein [Spirochaetales bacterium]|nr:PEGA domain-containing protein [Spirochaetales bacterium]